jgi:hypothetical protein
LGGLHLIKAEVGGAEAWVELIPREQRKVILCPTVSAFVETEGIEMDAILRTLQSMQWVYADGDPLAREQLKRRLAETARDPFSHLITYTDLVFGIVFHLPNVAHGAPLQLGMPEWTDLHRAIIGDFLGSISAESYEQGGFLASALVVRKDANAPGAGFRWLVEELGLVKTQRNTDFDTVWIDQIQKARDWYAAHDL